MRHNIKRQIWANLRGKKLKPVDNGPERFVYILLVIIAAIIFLIFGR